MIFTKAPTRADPPFLFKLMRPAAQQLKKFQLKLQSILHQKKLEIAAVHFPGSQNQWFVNIIPVAWQICNPRADV